MKYRSTKTYGHDLGLSCAFRQWRATSHCNKLHGYALSFKFVFEATELDHRNWVQDFGGLKPLREWLVGTFDHRLVVAADDPKVENFIALGLGLLQVANVIVLPAVGCEAFAKFAYEFADTTYGTERVKVISCEVSEHGANSAIYMKD